MHTHKHIHARAHACTHTNTYMHAHTHTHARAHTHTCICQKVVHSASQERNACCNTECPSRIVSISGGWHIHRQYLHSIISKDIDITTGTWPCDLSEEVGFTLQVDKIMHYCMAVTTAAGRDAVKAVTTSRPTGVLITSKAGCSMQYQSEILHTQVRSWATLEFVAASASFHWSDCLTVGIHEPLTWYIVITRVQGMEEDWPSAYPLIILQWQTKSGISKVFQHHIRQLRNCHCKEKAYTQFKGVVLSFTVKVSNTTGTACLCEAYLQPQEWCSAVVMSV